MLKSKLEISQRERHMNTWSRPGWCLLLCDTECSSGTETEATCGGTLVGLLLFLLHLRDNNDNNNNNSDNDNDNCKKKRADTSLSMTTCIIYKQLSTELHKMCTNDKTLWEFV